MACVAFLLNEDGSADGALRFTMRKADCLDEVWYRAPCPFRSHPDTLATVMSCLCGSAYDEMSFDFPISEHCRNAIERKCRALVTAAGTTSPRVSGPNVGLSFSGGYDSLAAWLMSPEYFTRIAMDWGGRFSRERRFFETLNPIIVSTNARELKVDKIDWRFMGTGTVLLSDFLDLGEIAFGTIFEGSLSYIRSSGPRKSPPLNWESAGLKDCTPTRGLNQVGTAMMIAEFAPDLIRGSLESLSEPGTEKYFRKQLLADCAVERKTGMKPDFSNYAYPKKKTPIGTTYAFDILSVFFVKRYGRDIVSRWASDLDKLPPSTLESIDEEIFFKYNPWFEEQIAPGMRDQAFSRMRKAGIGIYEGADWDSYEKLRDLLVTLHDI